MATSTIIVVNDDTVFLSLMHELLVDEGYHVIPWREGTGAYEVIKRERPALVILDIRMEHPEAGWQTLEVLKLDPATAPIPVIVCSADAFALQAKAQRLTELRCATLEKPFDFTQLLTLVAGIIGPPAGASL